MRVCIAQPEHLPWLGYFGKVASCDVFVFLDIVQFKRRYFENRNRVRAASGPAWVTVPVRSKGKYTQRLADVEIDQERHWQRPYWRTLEMSYGRAPFFERYAGALSDLILGPRWSTLVDLNIAIVEWGASALGFSPRFVRASALGADGRSTELLLDICRRVDASAYLSGPSGRDYIDEGQFQAARIALEYQDFRHPVYRQVYEPFMTQMSFVDLLFNHGAEAGPLLMSGQTVRLSQRS